MGKRKNKIDKGKVCVAAERALEHLQKEIWEYRNAYFQDLNGSESQLAIDIVNGILRNGTESTTVEREYEEWLVALGYSKPKSSVKDACAESVGQAHARLRHAAINWPGKKLRTRAHFLCDKLEDLSKAMGHPFPKTD